MIIPEGFSQVTHVFSGAAVPLGAVVTYGVENEDDTDPGTLAAAAHSIWSNNMLAFQSDSITLASTIVKNGPNDIGPTGEVSDPQDGTNPNAGCTPNVSYLVQKSTSVGGRIGRGRMYIPGVPESDVDTSGALDGTRYTVIQGHIQDFYDDWLASAVHQMVLLHTSSAHDPYRLAALSLSDRVATQRRRLRR